MKIILRILFTLLILTVIAVTAFIIVLKTIDPQKIIQLISSQLKQSYQLEIKVDRIAVEILKGIRMDNLWISRIGGFNKGTSVKVKKAYIIYNPVSFFQGTVDILNISCDGLQVEFNDLINLVNHFIKKNSGQKSAMKIVFRRVDAENSVFIFQKIPLKLKFELVPSADFWDSKLNVKLDSENGTVVSSGTAGFQKISLSGLKIRKFFPDIYDIFFKSIEGNLVRGIDDDFSLIFNGKTLSFDYLGYHFDASPDFAVEYIFSSQKALINNLDLKTGNNSASINSLEYLFPQKKADIRVSSFRIFLSDFIPISCLLKGDMRIHYQKNIDMSGTVHAENFNYRFIEDGNGVFTLKNNSLRGKVNLVTSGGNASGEVFSDNFFEYSFTSRFNAGELDIYKIWEKFKSTSSNTEDTDDNNSIMNKVKFGFSGEIQNTKYQKISLDNVKAAGKLEKMKWYLDNIEGDYYSGHVKINGLYSNPLFSGKFEYSEGKLKDFSEEYIEKPKVLYGIINGKGEFQVNTASLLKSTGKVNLTVTDGGIRNFLVQEKISQFLFDIPLDEILFDKIELNGELDNNLFIFNRLKFISDSIVISADGNVIITNMNMNLESTLSFSKYYLQGLPNPAMIFTGGYEKNGRINFNVALEGLYSKPKFKLLPK